VSVSCEREQVATLAGPTEPGRKRRAGVEIAVDLVFGPLAELLVRALIPLRVSPTLIVLANACAGLAAAASIFRGEFLVAAVLLQVKTLLDNTDGRLARATGRTSALGRYLDTEADLVVNIALFAALADVTGAPLLAALGFVALTLVLSIGFNEDVLYRRARGEEVVTEPPAASEGRSARILARVYRIVFGPQDRVLQAASTARLGRLLTGVSDPERRERASLAYHGRLFATIRANLGLSTQLVVLGVCLVIGEPEVFLWLALASAALLPGLQIWRELAARRSLRAES
jgi:archaetidylinositol phosphate synthase